MNATKILANSLRARQGGVRRKLDDELRFLRQKIDYTLERIAKGEPLDENLIQNAMGVTSDLCRYNLGLEVLPYLDEADKKEP